MLMDWPVSIAVELAIALSNRALVGADGFTFCLFIVLSSMRWLHKIISSEVVKYSPTQPLKPRLQNHPLEFTPIHDLEDSMVNVAMKRLNRRKFRAELQIHG